MNYEKISSELKKNSNKTKAKVLQKFFKTSKGEYAEGDIFLGISVPIQRSIAKQFVETSLEAIQKLLNSKIHEERLTGLLILLQQYEQAKKIDNKKQLKTIFDFYLNNTQNINNWDLVDLSAPRIIGDYLLNKNKKVLFKLAKSQKTNLVWLWEKRIAIVSTHTFIKNNEFEETLKIVEMFLKEEHDLLHKATGWMLRQIGKQNESILKNFLNKHKQEMPRTMLRYAIEKFDEKTRKNYLKK